MTTPPSDPALVEQPAEQRGDYRALFRLTRVLANLTLSGGVFLVWYLVAYYWTGRTVSVGIFLLTTTVLAMLLSFVVGLAAFILFKRRGGKVIRTEAPPGFEPRRRHFSPPPEQK